MSNRHHDASGKFAKRGKLAAAKPTGVDLGSLRRATQRRREANERWRREIEDAYGRGASTTEISEVAGVTRPTIRTILIQREVKRA